MKRFIENARAARIDAVPRATTTCPTTGTSNDALDDIVRSTLTAPPDSTGRFGEFGGRFVPETLVPACQELEAAFDEAWADPEFRAELDTCCTRSTRAARRS